VTGCGSVERPPPAERAQRRDWRSLRIWYEIPTMASPRVTVIIATYNWSAVLPYAIDSVLAQTMPDFELLVIGDGCTDDSEQVVTAIKDPRVRWINLPANTGHQSGPNNRGLQEARGEFVAYLGHDDLWLSHHLQCTTEKLDETGAAFAHSLLVRVPPDQDVGMPVLPKPQFGHGGPPSCTVHRRNVMDRIGGWSDYRTLSIPPETDFFYRAQAAGYHAVFVPRLTVIKFPASLRKNVYRGRPSHEQADWLRRMRSDPNFEAVHLVRVVKSMIEDIPREMLVRKLVSTFAQEFVKRVVGRILRIWPSRGGGIDRYKRYKGL
jgi:glycosyltransferase involved in cell wall biosynthesis